MLTEKETKAVKFIENIKDNAIVTLDHIAKEEPNVSPLVYKGREERANTILAMVEELKQYREIGTLEECRAAVDKQTAKKNIVQKEIRKSIEAFEHPSRHICVEKYGTLSYSSDLVRAFEIAIELLNNVEHGIGGRTMGRLIDANNLQFNGRNYNKSQVKAILDFIDAQPTAYDPDKVVEQLEKERNPIYRTDGSLMSNRSNIKIDKAIDIVKAGGVDGN